MKQIIIAFICLGWSTFLAAQNGYTIKGHVDGLTDNSKIYLIDGGRRKTIDSAIVKNETFTLKGDLSEAAHTYLFLGKSKKLADILLDNREIFVSGSEPSYDSIKVSGSEIDKQWKEWYGADQRIGYRRYQLNQISKSLTEKGDTAAGNKIKAIADELMNDRILLLKQSVKRNGDSPAGAVLPTLCTIQDQLTKDDVLQMYNSLSAKMKNTYFGNEIKKIASKK
jgi:hypothetical protein